MIVYVKTYVYDVDCHMETSIEGIFLDPEVAKKGNIQAFRSCGEQKIYSNLEWNQKIDGEYIAYLSDEDGYVTITPMEVIE